MSARAMPCSEESFMLLPLFRLLSPHTLHHLLPCYHIPVTRMEVGDNSLRCRQCFFSTLAFVRQRLEPLAVCFISVVCLPDASSLK